MESISGLLRASLDRATRKILANASTIDYCMYKSSNGRKHEF